MSIDQSIAILVLIGISIFFGTRRQTGVFQWIVIAFLAFLAFLFHDGGDSFKTSIVLLSILAIFYMKNRRNKGLSIMPNIRFKLPQRRQNIIYANDAHSHAQKSLEGTIMLLDEADKENREQTYKELQRSKSDNLSLTQELEQLKAENEALREEQDEQRRVEEATPRLRYYQNLARKKLDDEKSDLSKMTERRLKEEMQRIRDENRELKRNKNR